jgi:hypothetical protein
VTEVAVPPPPACWKFTALTVMAMSGNPAWPVANEALATSLGVQYGMPVIGLLDDVNTEE